MNPIRNGSAASATEWRRRALSSTLFQIESGNLGDWKSVGEGVNELRVHVGAGYRVYFGQHGQRLVILLCGGDKDSQQKDIVRAKAFWADWKRRQP